jgi:glycerophosphoryl diester phosphodiesterase
MVNWLFAFLLTAAPADPRPVEIIAHRGESHDAPENTLTAIRLAWERQVPAVELDVHLTADGQLAVCHDADTRRTTGVLKVLKESTFDELKGLDAGKWKGAEFAGEPIPLLEDALTTIPENGRCFIEVKVGPEAVPALVKAIRNCGKAAEQLVVISFNADTIAEARKQLPELQAYYLARFKRDEQTGEWSPRPQDLIAKAREIGAHGLNLGHDGPIDEALVADIRRAGLGFYVWTVDDPAIARRMVDLGVDGITTNRGAWLRSILESQDRPASNESIGK